jgi:hypothetical protein
MQNSPIFAELSDLTSSVSNDCIETTRSPIKTIDRASCFVKSNLVPRNATDRIATNTSIKVFKIWYVLAANMCNPTKLRLEPTMSIVAGIAKIIGFA